MIVLDCSAAINMAQNTPLGQLMKGSFLLGEKAVAPAFFQVEVANVAWKYAHAGRLSATEAGWLRDDALALVDAFYPTEDLMDEAFGLSVRLDHSVYDMMYLVLARRLNATLYTADKRLQDLCHAQGVSYVAEVG